MITQSLINSFFRVVSQAQDIAGNTVSIVEDYSPVITVDNAEEGYDPDHPMKKWVEIDEKFNVAKGKYAINRLGEVKHLVTGKILKQYLCKSSGYMCVSLVRAHTKDGVPIRPITHYGRKPSRETPRRETLMLVHRLVALVFIPNNNPCYTIVDHIDGNKFNNNYRNLRWCDQRTNSNNAKNNNKYWCVRWSKKYEKWYANPVTTIDNDGQQNSFFIGMYESEEQAARELKKFMTENYPNEMTGGRRFIED